MERHANLLKSNPESGAQSDLAFLQPGWDADPVPSGFVRTLHEIGPTKDLRRHDPDGRTALPQEGLSDLIAGATPRNAQQIVGIHIGIDWPRSWPSARVARSTKNENFSPDKNSVPRNTMARSSISGESLAIP